MFSGLTFICSGTLSLPRKKFEDLIKKNKGSISSAVNKKVSYLITTQTDFNSGTNSKIVTAQELGIYIVGEDFIHDSVKNKKLVSHSDYEFSHSKKKKKTEVTKIERIDVPEEIFSHVITFLHPIELFKFSLTSSKYLEKCKSCEIYLNLDDERFEKVKSAEKEKIGKKFLERFPHRIFGLDGYTFDEGDNFKVLGNLKVLRGTCVNEDDNTYDMLGKYCKNLENIEFLNSFETRVTPLFQGCNKLKSITFQTDECDIDIDGITDEDLLILSNNNADCLEEFKVNGLSAEVTEKGLMSVITKFQNLKKIEMMYNYTHQDEWDSNSPLSNDFFLKLFSLPKLEEVVMNAKLKKYMKKAKNYKEGLLKFKDGDEEDNEDDENEEEDE